MRLGLAVYGLLAMTGAAMAAENPTIDELRSAAAGSQNLRTTPAGND